jgi:transposase
MGTGIYLWHGQFLSRDRACQALSDLFGCALSPGGLAAAARKTAGLLAPALAAITRHLIAAEVVHFDETGFRAAGKLAWSTPPLRGGSGCSPFTPSGARTG